MSRSGRAERKKSKKHIGIGGVGVQVIWQDEGQQPDKTVGMK